MKVRSALSFLTEALREKLPEDRAKREAVEVLAHLLKVSPLNVYLKLDEEVEEVSLRQFVERRLTGEPLAYILGVAYFFGRPFEVGRGVLIPRPETEVLVEHFLEVCPPEGLILEIGLGSGAIAITILLERRGLRAIGVDISREALVIAKKNALYHGVLDRLYLVHGDAFLALRKRPVFSVILSNPPYISEAEYECLPEEVRIFEPREALLAGKKGTEFQELILRKGQVLLADHGFILLELGYNQKEAVRKMAEELSYHVEFRRDLLGYARSARLWKK